MESEEIFISNELCTVVFICNRDIRLPKKCLVKRNLRYYLIDLLSKVLNIVSDFHKISSRDKRKESCPHFWFKRRCFYPTRSSAGHQVGWGHKMLIFVSGIDVQI